MSRCITCRLWNERATFAGHPLQAGYGRCDMDHGQAESAELPWAEAAMILYVQNGKHSPVIVTRHNFGCVCHEAKEKS